MRVFIWAMVAMLALEAIGKACLLAKQNTQRDLSLMPFDITLCIAFLGWGIWLLARGE